MVNKKCVVIIQLGHTFLCLGESQEKLQRFPTVEPYVQTDGQEYHLSGLMDIEILGHIKKFLCAPALVDGHLRQGILVNTFEDASLLVDDFSHAVTILE